MDILHTTALELKTFLQQQMAQNPMIEDITIPNEINLTTAYPEEHQSGAISENELDFTPTGDAATRILASDDAERDTFLNNLENFTPSAENGSCDPDAPTRRQLLFDRQVLAETLQEHLSKQVALSPINPKDYAVAYRLIHDIDDNGYFTGSLPDIQMETQATKEKLNAILHQIQQFDPLGCGSTDLKTCLLAQMPKLDDSPYENEVRTLITHYLNDIAHHKDAYLQATLHLSPAEYQAALKELRTLNPRPGNVFATSSRPQPIRTVRPELFLRKANDGTWYVVITERDIPHIVISQRYLKMLEKGNNPPEVTRYLNEKLQAARALEQAIIDRTDTILSIAEEIVKRQQAVFNAKSLNALIPMTMQQIADAVGIHVATVSRTVNEKYLQTHFGIFSLRQFFTNAVTTQTGSVSKNSVLDRIRQIIEQEDKHAPFSDDKISAILQKDGITCKRRTVAKYRDILHIPGTKDRKRD